MFGWLVRVEYLRQGDCVRAADGTTVRVDRVDRHAGPHERCVALQAGDASLCVTEGHRVMVRRGQGHVPAPARSLHAADDVLCGRGVRRLSHPPVPATQDVPAFEIVFRPDRPIETFPRVPGDGILTMGHPPKKANVSPPSECFPGSSEYPRHGKFVGLAAQAAPFSLAHFVFETRVSRSTFVSGSC